MSKSLRIKFILFAMAAVTVLLGILGLSIVGLVRFSLDRQEEMTMNELVKSDGRFMFRDYQKEVPPKKLPLFFEFNSMRSARFFIARIDNDGNLLDIDLSQIMFIDQTDAEGYVKEVVESGSEKGRIEQYRYEVKETDLGKKIFFLDMSREDSTIKTLIFVSTVIAVVSWLIVFLFVVLLSGKVVQPIVKSIEKQKRFITDAGHELKTPLAIIQSNNDAMTLIHGENKYNRNIKTQVLRLSELTSNLLMQARLDENINLIKEQINVSVLTEETLAPFTDTAENLNFVFQRSIEPDLYYSTNREAYSRLLTLLMDNAMKYTTENGTIKFELASDSRHLLITEENTCDPAMNIDPERLFERFYRADMARTQKDLQSGYGIGLSVARSICEALGGTLNASFPEPGKIRFTARL